MLKGMKKYEDKEQDKTIKHEALRNVHHRATQNKNNTGSTALELPIAKKKKKKKKKKNGIGDKIFRTANSKTKRGGK